MLPGIRFWTEKIFVIDSFIETIETIVAVSQSVKTDNAIVTADHDKTSLNNLKNMIVISL